jgi:lambda family phage portal protein
MNPIDAIVNFFNPVAGLKRIGARKATEAVRDYDISSRTSRTDGWNRRTSSGAAEVSKGVTLATAAAQELCRNNPLANRVKRVWANNIVGGGISADINATSEKKADKFQIAWDKWSEGTECDFEGHYDFYGLQWLWMTTVVESGGVFVRRHINASLKFPLQLQTLEQSQLDRSKAGKNITDGIEYTDIGQIKGYWFTIDNRELTTTSKFFPVENIIHIFRKERAGQHLGMTWLHAVATLMRDYDTYKDAKLMQQQIAALFALFVEDADSKLGLGSDTKGTKDNPDELEPAMIQYVKQGTVPHVITPPKADNTTNFDVGLKRDMAVGSGITYEQLTGDYSMVNFASGRMGRSEFYTELDYAQKLMFKPGLMKVFGWFDGLYQVINGKGDYVIDWTFPTRAAVNPQEEFDVLAAKVRSGMISPSKAAKLLGERLEKVIAQWKKDKVLFGDLPFDIDPSKYAATGNQLNTDDAASSNSGSGGDNG